MSGPKKFYTAFVMYVRDGVTGELLQLHCTHKYLGEQTNEQMGDVARICGRYFSQARAFPKAVFNKREEFQKEPPRWRQPRERLVSVLTSFIHRDAFFPDLKLELDKFRADDFEEYKPHITLAKYPSVSGIFQAYAIMSGEQVICCWENREWQKQEAKRKLHAARPKRHWLTD